MTHYLTKTKLLSGSSYSELIKQARLVFHQVEKKSKRKPYLRSAYFSKEKIFFDYFWTHLAEKSFTDRSRRLKFFRCGLDLILHSKIKPTTKLNPNNKHELLYRFSGKLISGEYFAVQIKENVILNRKFLLSIFPIQSK